MISNILCVGLTCLDMIQVCKSFPIEDSDQRCLSHRWQRGGNASNICSVLSQIGANCEFLGTLCKQQQLNFILEDFKLYGICIKNCVHYGDCETPISTIIINDLNGSRTIIHSNKNLPELLLSDFKKLDLAQYSWVHFEGRNVKEVASMIKWIDQWNINRSLEENKIKISVELEKLRLEMLEIVPLADVVFVGKEFAGFIGCNNMSETLKTLTKYTKATATIIVAWGELGAMGLSPDENIVQSSAFPPSKVVDTLGAGDTFCAGVIHALSLDKSLQDSLSLGCQLAGAKVGMSGYRELDKIYQQIIKENFS